MGDTVRGVLFDALKALDKSSDKLGAAKDLMEFISPAEIEKDVKLYDYERVGFKQIRDSIKGELDQAKIIQNVSFDRNIITAKESAAQNQQFKDANEAISYGLNQLLRESPLLSTGVSLAKDSVIKSTQPYNSTQTEYKINIDYTKSGNIVHNMTVYVRTGDYQYQNQVLNGPVEAIVAIFDINSNGQKKLVNVIKIPDPRS